MEHLKTFAIEEIIGLVANLTAINISNSVTSALLNSKVLGPFIDFNFEKKSL